MWNGSSLHENEFDRRALCSWRQGRARHTPLHFSNKVFFIFFCTHLLTRPTIDMKAQVHQAAHFHLEMNLKVVRSFYLQPDWAFIELLPWLLWLHLQQISLWLKMDGVHISACRLGNNPENVWMPPQGHACSGCHQLYHPVSKMSHRI